MLSAAELEARSEALAHSADLSELARRLAQRSAPLLARAPVIPAAKALLSRDGGVCPDDGATLQFDPWSPTSHRCPRCGRSFSGERHERAWARHQHLWLAERAATLATLAALTGNEGAAKAAARILQAYADAYFSYPNRDNVLGPSRLFFSTYLESIWLSDYLSAATLLRERGLLPDDLDGGVATVADEAANLIGDFDEGLSNRQTWHNAALAAIAVWFEDEELLARAVQAPTGMVAHLVQGFGEDGLWYEGENYHLFALRGQLVAMGWASQAGVDLLQNERLAARLLAALRAPALTALPDHTVPARKDSRFGLSLAQPMYLELWEVGLARLGDDASDLWGWLAELYAAPAPPAETFDAYLHEAGEPAPSSRTRADLSWWALLEMAPALPGHLPPWRPGSVLMERQGLAVLRRDGRYASLECGQYGGGHGHPDRLHLTLYADGQLWLPDPGTGSYVSPDLFWYRSTVAHNAPRLDGRSQPAGDAVCEAFDVQPAWGWARGRFGDLSRTLVAGETYLLDVVERSGADDRLLELAWHPAGTIDVVTPGEWSPAALQEPFVDAVEQFGGGTGGLVLRAEAQGATFTLRLQFDGELYRATGPGLPDGGIRRTFYLVRIRGRGARIVSVLDPGGGAVQSVRTEGELVEIGTAAGVDRHLAGPWGWEVSSGSVTLRLGGLRKVTPASRPLVDMERRTPPVAVALAVRSAPALDGTLDEFDAGEPITLDHEDQYRRSEEPYAGPEELCATAFANWDEEALYLGVDVVKPEVIARPGDAVPLLLDNEPDDIHGDGLQLYLRLAADGPLYGWLVALAEDGELRVAPTSGSPAESGTAAGRWQPTETGYQATLRVAPPEWSPRSGDLLGFDLLINEARGDRERRAGQLVWSGGGGWVYLRGDRQAPGDIGRLELR